MKNHEQKESKVQERKEHLARKIGGKKDKRDDLSKPMHVENKMLVHEHSRIKEKYGLKD